MFSDHCVPPLLEGRHDVCPIVICPMVMLIVWGAGGGEGRGVYFIGVVCMLYLLTYGMFLALTVA